MTFEFSVENNWADVQPLVPDVVFESDNEQRVLAGMLKHEDVIQNVIHFRQQVTNLFRSPISNKFASLVIGYYEKYNTPPDTDITRFLETASQDVQSLCESLPPAVQNSQVVLDITEKYFQEVQLERHTDAVKQLLQSGNVKAAQDAMAAFTPIQQTQNTAFDPFNSPDIISAAFDESEQSMLKFTRPDEAAFYGDTFSRDSFVLILASEKSGKSMTLLDFAVRAVEQNKNVAYFECGDLSRNQHIKRFIQRIGGVSRKIGSHDFPKELIVTEQNKICQYNVVSDRKETTEPFDAAKAAQVLEKWLSTYNSVGKMRVSVHANSTQSVTGINAALDEWSVEGWEPDFIIIDYADLLKADMKAGSELRHQIDSIYRQLRQLSQVRHCCVLTATQATREASKVPFMTRDCVSEAKTKLAHVTACLGLHANIKEVEEHIIKINHVVIRDGECLPHMPMYCATALSVCQPAAAVYYPYYRDNPGRFPRYDQLPDVTAFDSSGIYTGGDFGQFAESSSEITGQEVQNAFGFESEESDVQPFDFGADVREQDADSDGLSEWDSPEKPVNTGETYSPVESGTSWWSNDGVVTSNESVAVSENSSIDDW